MILNKIACISDLHVDNWLRVMPSLQGIPNIKHTFVNEILINIRNKHNPDKIIIAGDLWNGSCEANLNFGDDVEYVMGNHDYYHENFPDETPVTLQGTAPQIVGRTLWTNFWNNEGDYPAELIFRGISDNRLIEGSSHEVLSERFEKEWAFLMDTQPEIVITHFPPTLQAIAGQFQGNPYNPYFVNDKEKEILDREIATKLWVYGHVHHPHDYYVGDTLFICNPMGYPGENYYNITEYEPVIVVKEDGAWKILK